MLLDHTGREIDPAVIEAVRRTNEDRYPVAQRVATPGITKAGVPMTPDRALQVSTVWACVRFLSQTVSRLDWNLRAPTVEQNGREGSKVLRTHPVHALLRYRLCEEQSSFQFREILMRHALLWGNGYAEIEWNAGGQPIALWPIHPTRVCVMRDIDTGELFYQIYNNVAGTVNLDKWSVFHLRGLGEDVVGLSVMAYAAQSIGWAQAVQLFGASFFRSGANPSGVVTSKRPLSPDGLALIREDFLKLYGGPAGSNKTMFLDNEMDYKPISIEQEKAQFIETNQYLLDEVCRWFGCPPHKIYNLLRATFSNIEHQSIEVVTDSIRPWVKRFQDEADFKLLGENRRRLYTQIEVNELLMADTATRMQFYQGLRNIGALNTNEIRDFEGLNSIGPDGEKYTMQSGMTTLDKIGANGPVSEPAPMLEPEPDPNAELRDNVWLRSEKLNAANSKPRVGAAAA
jgi:HK97 family phage portal protein